MSSMPVRGQQVVAGPPLGVIVLLEPPVVTRMVIRQCPHHVAAEACMLLFRPYVHASRSTRHAELSQCRLHTGTQ